MGFSYWLYPLEKVLHEKLTLEENCKDMKISKDNFVDDFQKAIKEITAGKKVQLNYE